MMLAYKACGNTAYSKRKDCFFECDGIVAASKNLKAKIVGEPWRSLHMWAPPKVPDTAIRTHKSNFNPFGFGLAVVNLMGVAWK